MASQIEIGQKDGGCVTPQKNALQLRLHNTQEKAIWPLPETNVISRWLGETKN